MDKKTEKSIKNKLIKLKLYTPNDYIFHIPLRYENETTLTKIIDIPLSKYILTEGTIINVDILDNRFKNKVLVVSIKDDTGCIQLRWLHFYNSQITKFIIGNKIRVGGEAKRKQSGLEIIHPKIYNINSELPKNLTPIYSTIKGLSQTKIRRIILEEITKKITDTLPSNIVKHFNLMTFDEAIKYLHYPPPDNSLSLLPEKNNPAWTRVKFDELLAHELSIGIIRQNRMQKKAYSLPKNANFIKKLTTFIENLEFTLTDSQKNVINEISNDLSMSFPMNRLLQGDVGCGKTVVAIIAAIQAISSNKQVALMTPTEILTEQHFYKIKEYCRKLEIIVEYISSNKSIKDKKCIKERVVSGEINFIIGTQSLIQEHIYFNNLGLLIIDEQHRFGVEQRSILYNKGVYIDKNSIIYPHLLSMSATPIPRTLAMTLLDDMDISTIKSLPKDRKPIITKLISDDRREEVLKKIVKFIRSGCQAYWVCPMILENEKIDLQNAVDTFEDIKNRFPDLKIGLIHSNLTNTAKNEIMQFFRNGDINLLIATTVIEVGVDVPNASLMVVEHSERFGLAQLHQLRGRIGRGSNQSICILLYQKPLSLIAKKRLRAIFKTLDGFKIAQYDLLIRGPGDFLGTKQSGVNLFRFANIETDQDILEKSKEAASMIKKYNPECINPHINRWKKNDNYL
ncbi:MAG: ATP-dependent DNA helicase RecG [Candidatus Kinetoplastibacterium crithidii]|nr:MAG: ATP-dependent DNA helicase RecG [Candidatus Kinetoplastibacterium crithidii]